MPFQFKPARVFYGWWIVGAAFIVALYTGGVVFYGFTAIFEPIVEDMGLSYAQVGGVASDGIRCLQCHLACGHRLAVQLHDQANLVRRTGLYHQARASAIHSYDDVRGGWRRVPVNARLYAQWVVAAVVELLTSQYKGLRVLGNFHGGRASALNLLKAQCNRVGDFDTLITGIP